MDSLFGSHADRLQHNIMIASYPRATLEALEALNGTLDREMASAIEEIQMVKACLVTMTLCHL